MRRLVADGRRRRLPQAGGDWIGVGRTFGADTVSPESFPGYHDFPYNTTQATYSAPLSSRVLLEAGYSRFAYGYARFGMAPPDGLMDLIPVTEQSGIYGRPNFTYRGVFDPLDFGFNDNDALQIAWRASMSYVTGAHNMKVGYQGYFSEVHNGRVAEPHAAAIHVQQQRARSASRTSCRRAGISTIARRRVGCSRRTSGRSAG